MAAHRPLRMLCWEGYQLPSITEPFAARAGCPVEASTLVSDAATAAMLRSENCAAWDVLNINNAYVAKDLWPAGRIEVLSEAQFGPAFDTMLPQFRRLYRWSRAPGSGELIGICQRFGAFNLVVNTHLVSRSLARDEGFSLADDGGLPFGVLQYEDFNIFHICIASGFDPFAPLTVAERETFSRTAERWFSSATLVTDDHHALNQALVERRIAFYLSGGVYTASPVRLAGHLEVEAITPCRGPIVGPDGAGRGGIAFTEITSVLRGNDPHPEAADFLAYLLEPDTAVKAALTDATCNPVAQMGNPTVMRAFSRAQLDAIQWDTLDEDIERCADYDLVPDHADLLSRLRAAADASY